MFQAFLGYVKVLEGVPGFLEGVPGCSGFSRRCSGAFRAFHTVPGVPGCSGVPCSGVPVFRCSGVPDITTCPFYGTNAGSDSTDLSM